MRIYKVLSKFLMSVCILALFTITTQAQSKTDDKISVIRAIAPNYPFIALSVNISGLVEVEVQITNEGTVSNAKVVGGHKLLQPSAEHAAKKWLFTPSQENNNVRKINLKFNFIIMPENTYHEDLWSTFLPPYSIEIREKKRDYQ